MCVNVQTFAGNVGIILRCFGLSRAARGARRGVRPTDFQVSPTTSQMRVLAEHLIVYETGGKNSAGPKTAATFPVCEKLRPHLATLMGNTGFSTLLLRALARAQAEVPSLRAVQVEADGSLAGFDELVLQVDPQELARGNVVLVAQLLGLLVTFIGEPLVLRIASDAWPELAISDLNLYEKDET